jgi:hypothetical protein
MSDHEIDDYWVRLFRQREEADIAQRALTDGTVRFEETCFHPFHHLVEGEEL